MNTFMQATFVAEAFDEASLAAHGVNPPHVRKAADVHAALRADAATPMPSGRLYVV